MIFLNPPYLVVDGYTILPDHADLNQFYYIPPAPQLLLNEQRKPSFSLVQYLGGGAGEAKIQGGLLTLATGLFSDLEAQSRLREQVAARTDNRAGGEIRLSPVLFDEGTVELVALGQSSTPPTATTEAVPSPLISPTPTVPPGPFQIRFLGSGRASLGGDNRAVFQLMMGAPEAELLEKCLDTPDLPIIVIYRLAFAGLRPSYEINLQADWSKVYRTLQNHLIANAYYVSADVEVNITRALEENNIKIETSIFGTGSEARSAAERARKYLMDWVLEHLFTPMIDPAAAKANSIGETIQDTAWSLLRSVIPGVGYKLRAVAEDQLRLLNARMEESCAERREVVPQGTLGGILNRFRVDEQGRQRSDWNELRETLVNKINLDGFPRLDIKVAVEDRFSADGLSEVLVEIGRIQADNTLTDQRLLSFRSASERESYTVNLLGVVSANFAAPYRYRTEVRFNPAGVYGAHAPVTSDWRNGSAGELFVEPRDAYAIREAQVSVSPTFSFVQFPNVTVELEYNADGSDSIQRGRVQLSADSAENIWRFRSFSQTPRPYRYRITYHRTQANGGNIVSDWKEQVEDWLPIPDPLPTKRALNLFVNLPWQNIMVAFVQLKYQDEANNIRHEEQIDLNAQTRFLRRDIPIAKEGSRAILYRLTIFMNDGRLMEGAWRETADERLLLDQRIVEQGVITIRTVGGNLRDNRLEEVRVQLQVRDPNNDQVKAETEMRLLPDGGSFPHWEWLLGDPPLRAVHYRATFVDKNGFATTTPWQSTESNLLVVHLRNKSVSA